VGTYTIDAVYTGDKPMPARLPIPSVTITQSAISITSVILTPSTVGSGANETFTAVLGIAPVPPRPGRSRSATPPWVRLSLPLLR